MQRILQRLCQGKRKGCFKIIFTRKTIVCFLLAALVLLSCKQETVQEKNIAELPEPLKTYIAATKDCTCKPYIDKYLWRNQTVYLSSCSGPACDCMTLYYDTAGTKIQMDSGYYPSQFRQEAQLVAHVWRCNP